ncbi:PAS domain S-box protein [Heyndrickxia sp. NPDC080065]|uniref:PAS domain S-box protein n=1 Tax=Heyndrickxia sp. NPDC080065 TaxID=3390568 RepID=UPI003D07A55C
MINNLNALDKYTSPKLEKIKLEREWENFISGNNTAPTIRGLMYDSWKRCLDQGISPLQSRTSINLDEEQIKDYVSMDPLFRIAKPVLSQLKDKYMDAGQLVTFSNPSGEIVHLEGDLSIMLKAEDMNFVAGSSWAENSAGTNAIGTAIATGSPIQVFAGEHFCQEVQNWTCAAAPIRDPATDKIIGIIDMTGLWALNHPYFLSAVTSAAQDVTGILLNQLKLERFKLLEYFQSQNISLQSNSFLVVLDRGWKVVKASPILYEQKLIDSNHFLVGMPSLSLSLTSRTQWEFEYVKGIWRFELTPYIYGGMPIGSIIHVIPPNLPSFNKISITSECIFSSVKDQSLTKSNNVDSARNVNEKKHALVKNMVKCDDFYKSFFDHNPDGIYSCDLKGNLLDVNPALERMVGYTAEELQNLDLPLLFYPGYLEIAMKYFEKTIKGKPQEYEAAVIHKYGYRVDVKVKNFPIYIDNEIVGEYGIVKDISENRKMEKDLQSTKQQLDLFLKNTVDSIIIFDLQHIIKVNKAFEEVFGWTEQEVIGRPIPIIPDFLVEECTKILQQVKNSKHVMSFETIKQRKDGSLVDVNSFVSPIVNEKGNVTAIVSILRDITEHKQMEKALKESEMKYRLLFEQAADAVYLVELNAERLPTRFIEVNPVGCERFECSRDEFLSMPFTEIVPKDSTIYIKMMEKIRQGERLFTLQDEYVFKTGQRIDVEFSLQVFNLGGKDMLLAISRDITERLKTEELLRKSEKLAVVGHLATAISHEVNNPLTTMKGFIQLLGSAENENKNRYIDLVLSEIGRIEGITNEFMAVAKPQAVKVQPSDIYKLVEQATLLFEHQATMNNVQIRTKFESGIPLIPLERNQLNQVFINILKNSFEAMPLGGEILIQVNKSNDQEVCISIIDQGCGIPKDRLPYLGEPFYSIKEEGIGLGLMICYKIIEAHQGKLFIESELDKGTKVEVILPICGNHSFSYTEAGE